MSSFQDEQNKKLVEQTLDKAINQMLLRCRLAPADWDCDEQLRLALQHDDCLPKINLHRLTFDKTFETAIKSGITLDNKYNYIYKL